jgi:hypothetical protein
MLKIKLLAGPAVLLAIMAAWAAPAMAEFESNGQGGEGSVATYPEAFTLTSIEGGPAVECKTKNAEGKVVAEAKWDTQMKLFEKQGKFFYQPQKKRGPHLQIKLDRWGTCVGPTGIAVNAECTYQVEQGGQRGSTYSMDPGCRFRIGTVENFCDIEFAQDGNKELSEAKVVNEGANAVALAINGTGLTSTIQESKTLCKTLSIKGGQKTGTLKTKNAFILEGLKLV